MAKCLYGCLWLSPKAATEAADEALYFFALNPANRLDTSQDRVPAPYGDFPSRLLIYEQQKRVAEATLCFLPDLPTPAEINPVHWIAHNESKAQHQPDR